MLVFAGLFVLGGAAPAQVTYKGFHDMYRNESPLRVLGWSEDERYFVFDTTENQFGALDHVTRYVVSASDNRIFRAFREGDDHSTVPLDKQSAALLKRLGVRGDRVGTLAFRHPVAIFPKDKMPTARQIATDVRFRAGKASYRLRLRNEFSKSRIEKHPEGAPAFGVARPRLTLSGGVGSRTLQRSTYADDAMLYGIERVYVSPSRRHAAVVLVLYRGGFFEGWNVSAEHMVLVGRLR